MPSCLSKLARVSLLSAVSLVALGLDKAAVAQQVAAEEIVVTARKRSESLISVPVAVSAISAAEVNKYAATDLIKIAQLAPQVNMYRGGSGTGGSFVIRGISSAQGDAGLEQTVTVNIDGIQVSRGIILNTAMFDLQQVEILKGPQALFFGKNSPAGVVSVSSANPTDKFEGYAKVGYEFTADERFVEGAIGGPVTKRLKVRIAARASAMDGWIKNTATPIADPANPSVILPGAWSSRGPDGRTYAGRVTAIADPTDNLQLTFKALYGNSRYNGDSNWETKCAPGVRPTSNGFIDPQDDCTFNFKRTVTAFAPIYVAGTKFADGIPFSKNENTLISLNADWRLGAVTLSSVTGYYRLDKSGRDDSTGSSISQSGGGTDELNTTYTEELRAVSDFDGPLNFTIGAYYDDTKRTQFTDLRIRFVPPDPLTGSRMTSTKAADNKYNTYSAFGQIRWEIIKNLELAGGARWTREEKETVQNQPYVNAVIIAPPFNFAPPSQVLHTKYTGENVSPEATLTWHPNANTTLYAAYKTGYKSGGIANPNTLSRLDTDSTVLFGEEKAKGEEIGFKGLFLNRRLRVDLTAYRYTYKGLQTSSYDPIAARYILRNAAAARTTGVEGSVDFVVTQELGIRAAFGYNDAKFLSFPGAPCYTGETAAQGCIAGQADFTGKRMYRAPRFSGNIGGSYDVNITDSMMVGFNTNVSYTSGYNPQENLNPLAYQKAYLLVDAGARLYGENEKWEVAFIGKNLSNAKYTGITIDRPAGTAGQIIIAGNRARELILQSTFRF